MWSPCHFCSDFESICQGEIPAMLNCFDISVWKSYTAKIDNDVELCSRLLYRITLTKLTHLVPSKKLGSVFVDKLGLVCAVEASGYACVVAGTPLLFSVWHQKLNVM
jgi:hypothetical protein